MQLESITTTTALAVALLALGACSPGKPPAPVAEAPAETAPPARGQTVFDTQLRALDKAKAVQGTLDAQSQATSKAIDAAGG